MGNRADREPDLPPLPAKPGSVSLDGLRKAVDDNAKMVRTIYTAFLGFCLYVAVLASSTTHEQLLRDKAPKIPFIDIELPVTGIYFAAPLLVLLFHFELMLQMTFLARTTWQFKSRLDQEALSPEERVDHLDMLNSSPFVYMLIGEHFNFATRFLMRLMMGITVFAAPPALFLIIQGAFLPYHHPWLHNFHIALLTLDSIFMLFFWHQYFKQPVPSRASTEMPPQASDLSFDQRFRLAFQRHKTAIGHALPYVAKDAGRATMVLLLALVLNAAVLVFAAAHSGWWFVGGLIVSFILSFTSRTDINSGFKAAYCIMILICGTFGSYRPFDGCGDRFLGALSGNTFVWTAEESLSDFGRQLNQNSQGLCKTLGNYAATVLSFPASAPDNRTPPATQNPLAAAFRSTILPPRTIEYHRALLKIEETEAQDGNSKSVRKLNLGLNLASRDLRAADLSYASLDKADMTNANLSYAALYKATLHETKLTRADLSNSDLGNATLYKTDLYGARLDKANLMRTTLTEVDMEEASLNSASLSYSVWIKAILYVANFTNAHMDQAEFEDSFMDDGIFDGANLTNASLKKVTLGRASFKNATLDNIRMTDIQAIRPDFRDASLQRAWILNLNLQEANFRGAKLMYARLYNTKLVNSELQQAGLNNATLVGSSLYMSNLDGADLSFAALLATDLSYAKLYGANMKQVSVLGSRFHGTYLHGAILNSTYFLNTDLRSASVAMNALSDEGKADARSRIHQSRPGYNEAASTESCITSENVEKTLFDSRDQLFCKQRPVPGYERKNGTDYTRFYADLMLSLRQAQFLCTAPESILGILEMVPTYLANRGYVFGRDRDANAIRQEEQAATKQLYLPLIQIARTADNGKCQSMSGFWERYGRDIEILEQRIKTEMGR